MDLNVRVVEALTRGDEGAGFEKVLAPDALAGQRVAEADAELAQALHFAEHRAQAAAAPVHDDVEVILQVAPDTG